MPKNMETLQRSYMGPSTPNHNLFNNATELPDDLNFSTMDVPYDGSMPMNMSSDSLMNLLEDRSKKLACAVDTELARESTASEFVAGFSADSPQAQLAETGAETGAAGGSKRKASEVDSDSDSDDSSKGKKLVNKPKIRQRYKKATIQNRTSLTEERQYSTEICTVAAPDQIAKYFAQDFSAHLNEVKSECQMSANRFSDYISETGYYVFVVKKGDRKPFEVVFAKFVNNATNEYTNNYYMVDNRVFVVSLNNVKFMVSYKLVREQGIDIPPHVNLCNDAQAERTPLNCYFEPVKNAFQATLINHFHLDMFYAQTTFVTLMQAVGENKTNMLLNKLYQMYQDRSLFTLPIMLSRKEPVNENAPQNKNHAFSYVAQIMKYSKNLRFPQGDPTQQVMDRLEEIVTQKSSLTYKYSSVANLLFNRYGRRDNNADALKKVKKEDGNRLLVEQYMSYNENDDTSHNFIVLQFGGVNDERLTIAKRGKEFYWIAGEIKDISVDDLIKKYARNVHHVFRIINVNRRESTTWHNNLLKLLQLLLQNLIRLEDVQRYSDKSDTKFVYKKV
ncbi:immediate early gene 1 [Orgyia pseudotsugata multiple nucleopolyhedrovirus]|uniref:Trans-activating transcriptional regulatory protein n=1 Tax=Orgyia pseudotsugata multicapsid polyhedrosis virus TaxID=262177 RepID=TATR_NPVOP|nr:immediate early gene 1 [Orgyia pseudotsugata multiple nucleopolyhedrovirus]P22114.1 RecName: Full=Trans-activating transcriptional regulatory protein; AltName: Full=Immediate early protein 1; Short=IE-1 [Orgyia pseudotsugata multiple nucleopolyhedrovirus]pir/T10414/ immediate early protein 1 - Orgyia pseudotsugata nuclear polyhedrosis virus [Orgyia pseudotsugata single capsid nuclopolyhedrovirus]AAA46700.1 OpIE-1 [Orgyia pseudotsugata single capsid nuclopolyhedrovirus]AAC59144.1 immediate ea